MAKLEEPLGKVLGRRPQDGRPRPGDRGRPAAPLSAPVRPAWRADRAGRPRRRRTRHRHGRGRKVEGRCSHKPGYLLEITVTDGTGELTLTFFGTGAYVPGDASCRRAPAACSPGKVAPIGPGGGRPNASSTTREYQVIGRRHRPPAQEWADELIPVYPATKGLNSWQIQDSLACCWTPWTSAPDPLPAAAAGHGTARSAGRALRRHPPAPGLDEVGQGAQAAEVGRGVRRSSRARAAPAGGRRAAGHAAPAAPPAACSTPSTRGCRSPSPTASGRSARRSPRTSPASTRCTACCRATSARARRSSRCGRCSRWSTPAARPRCWRRPRCSPQQHPASITPMLGAARRRPGELGGADRRHPGRAAHRLAGRQGPPRRRCSTRPSGAAGIVVGTHALLQENVQFADLGLVVVDEQHRFGVEQRDALRAKVSGGRPHVLVMTATPIPRTVAMTVFGDLETSVLRQLPGRPVPVATHVVPAPSSRAGRPGLGADPRGGRAGPPGVRRVPADRRRGGRRAAPRPTTTAASTRPAAAGRARRRARAAPRARCTGLRIGVLHGRLPPDDKDAVMRAFAAGELDVLVATTVIEVGVDVPNATVMVVMDADRFGVSQLHQLRGRVGPGQPPGLCLLVTEAPDGTRPRERLAAVASTTDGFELSRLDLEHAGRATSWAPRSPGSRSGLRLLTLLHDEESSARPGPRPRPGRRRPGLRPSGAGRRLAACWTRSARNTWRRHDTGVACIGRYSVARRDGISKNSDHTKGRCPIVLGGHRRRPPPQCVHCRPGGCHAKRRYGSTPNAKPVSGPPTPPAGRARPS